jgi:radical SAM protein with 4Fe4S-binding SPASM domain
MHRNLAVALPRVPTSCFWEITDACNLRCLHCEADAGRRSADELTTAEALGVAARLQQLGCRSVHLTGGEPLVRDDWPVIARRLHELGLEVTLISNGTLIDAEVIRRMRQAGVSGLSISLDGEREVHDALRVPARSFPGSRYDAAIRALGLAVGTGLKTAVITQVHRRNLRALARMYAGLAELAITVWQVQLCMPLGRALRHARDYLLTPEDLPELEETLAELVERSQLRIAVADNIGYYGRREPTLRGSVRATKSFWLGCLAGCRVLALGASGDVKGCPSHPRKLVVGNLRQTPLEEIWADARRFAYNTEWDESRLEGKCRECAHRQLCRAGCTTMAYAVTGSIHQNPYCVQGYA